MNLPNIFNFDLTRLSEPYANELLKINEQINEQGLVITLEDAKQIINTRDKVLNNYGRVELSLQATEKIMKLFSYSSFINQNNYVRSINDLQETFYYLRNETKDKISDDKLIELMKDLFENSCEGSIELLNSLLEEFSVNYRKG
ncbi:DUF6323 family protein [Inconstantimicrobium mannanitabidum]|uniref:Uncharacterized protein n=1 Tax=Inconstantimicrobium mannanitabidum TaxID=1604901 RepID=A0ACB5RCZ3_9CLOT|nr:DUF6323 family protein [Clostridium sp. TW13]GKX67139.1 hypothetical protein rsdtw13_23970 [Clostridium sp. TW13]